MFETELAALEALVEGFLALPETILAAIVACVYLLLYPMVLLLDMGYYWVTDLIGSYMAIPSVIYDLSSTISTDVVGMFSGVLPSAWVLLLGSVVALNVAIRVYYLLKGVSIFGWSL